MSEVGAPKTRISMQKHAATQEWIENHQTNGESTEEEDLESIAESSVVESSDGDYETDTETDLESNIISTQLLGTQIGSNEIYNMESLKEIFNSINSVQTVGDVNIENSTGVHIGNVTNINGDIQIIQLIKRKPKQKRDEHTTSSTSDSDKEATHTKPPIIIEEREERVRRDAFIDRIKFKIPKELCSIVPRSTWVAQMPMEDYDHLQSPAQFVIISHTATESSEKQAINIRIVRDVQCFHIESRGWNDIAYNFLIGCDGNVYEGRGWGVVGAHTMGYNSCSLGICFIGCFMRDRPTEAALNACKSLLKKAVDENYISRTYKLIGHCQCRSTESPGRKLFEELQTWEHFYNMEDE